MHFSFSISPQETENKHIQRNRRNQSSSEVLISSTRSCSLPLRSRRRTCCPSQLFTAGDQTALRLDTRNCGRACCSDDVSVWDWLEMMCQHGIGRESLGGAVWLWIPSRISAAQYNPSIEMVGVAEAFGLITGMMAIIEQLVRLAERAQRNRHWRSYMHGGGCSCTHGKLRKQLPSSTLHHISTPHKSCLCTSKEKNIGKLDNNTKLHPPSICSSFATGNREMCAQLKNHVEMVSQLLTALQSQWMPDPVTYSLLENLSVALNDGKALVESCQEKRTWSLVFKTQKKAKKIAAVDARISKILEAFHIANMIRIVSINKERFFMNVLEKLLQHGACKNLPQHEKEELKTSIKNLTNMENMSSDAKRVVEWIVRDLTDGTEAPPSQPVHQQGGLSSASNAEVVDLALSVVQNAKALRHSRPEIQLLVQFAQQIADLMQQPESRELSEDPNTKPMVTNLKEQLREASRIVSLNEQHRNNRRIAQTFLCGVDGGYYWQQPSYILNVAYQIEYYVQVLPVVTMRQMFNSA